MLHEILHKAIGFYGVDMQLNVCIEELSELIKEICKFKRGNMNINNISEEMADVKIMLQQLEIIFKNTGDIETFYDAKIDRLSKRIDVGSE